MRTCVLFALLCVFAPFVHAAKGPSGAPSYAARGMILAKLAEMNVSEAQAVLGDRIDQSLGWGIMLFDCSSPMAPPEMAILKQRKGTSKKVHCKIDFGVHHEGEMFYSSSAEFDVRIREGRVEILSLVIGEVAG